jgi:hypothetical protein
VTTHGHRSVDGGDVMEDDAKYFEQALQEYREATGDYSRFPELERELQSAILKRAQQFKDTEFEKVMAA